jgi:citrate lyase subunit beta / citryl-CoA lyase
MTEAPVRSMLFVPGDSERKLARSLDCPADAIILDLEDSVAPSKKPAAREVVRAALQSRTGDRQYWVRINALDSGEALKDLAAVTSGKPDVLLFPKANGAQDVQALDHYLSALETREGVEVGAIRVVVVATETGASIFGLGSYQAGCPRLIGLTWGAEDLAAAVGAASNSDEQGALTPLYQLARSLCLAASAAADVTAIDTAFMGIKDLDALRANCDAARRDGFRGKLAIHPDQVPIINAAFTPSAAEIAEAEKIIAAFDAQPDVGAFQLDGRMIDIPHLKQARHILSLRSALGLR